MGKILIIATIGVIYWWHFKECIKGFAQKIWNGEPTSKSDKIACISSIAFLGVAIIVILLK